MPTAPPLHRPNNRSKRSNSAQARQAKRYYATNSTQWRSIRAAQLAKQPLCQDHLEIGITVEATVVDHVDGDASTYDSNHQSNLKSLCASCHSRKTALHDGGFGRARVRP